MDLKEKIKGLSTSLIKFERKRDPVGEKTTKIGSHKGGRRHLGRRSYFGGLSLRQMLKPLIFSFKSFKSF